MRNSELTDLISTLWRMSEASIYVPLLVWGEAGIGKSDTVRDAARALDVDFVDLRLGNLEAPDLMGLMRDEMVYPCVFHVEEGTLDPLRTGERFTASGLWHHVRLHHADKIPRRFATDPAAFVEWNKDRLTKLGFSAWFEMRTVYSAPAWFPAPDSAGILFLDEMNRSTRETRQGVFQLVLDRRIHELELPGRWVVISANNPSTSTASGGFRTYADVDEEMEEDKAFMSRFLHVVLDSSASEWTEWAIGRGIEQSIVSMLDPANSNDVRVRKLLGLKGALLPLLEPTPRSWTALARFLSGSTAGGRTPRGPMLSEVVRGLVGESTWVTEPGASDSEEEKQISIAPDFVDFLRKTSTVDPTGRKELPTRLDADEAALAMEVCLDLLRKGDPAGKRELQILKGMLPDDELSRLEDMIRDVLPEEVSL